MSAIELHDLKRRLASLSKSLAEITIIACELSKKDPLTSETIIEETVIADLPEVRMLAAHLVKKVPGGKGKLRWALKLCKAESVTALFDTPDQIPKFIRLLEKDCGKSIAQVTAKVVL